MRKISWGGHCLAVSLCVPLAAVAQTASNAQQNADEQAQANPVDIEQLQEVVVTAEKRAEDVQTTPVSITVITGDQVAQQGGATGNVFVQQALQSVPGVTIQGGAGAGIGVNIRGVQGGGGTAAAGAAAGPGAPGTTATYVDGVPGFLGGNYDVSRIEVLRGPQGTLFGRSATGGVLNIVTNDPMNQYQAQVTMEGGSYDLMHTSGMLNIPLNDQWALRGAFDTVNREGYYSNGSGDDVEQNARLKLGYKSDMLSMVFAGDYSRTGPQYGAGNVPGFVSNDPSGYSTPFSTVLNPASNTWKTYANINADLGFANLVFIPSYLRTTTPPEVLEINGVVGLQTNPSNYEYSGELRLESRPGSWATWVVGTNLLVDNNNSTNNIALQIAPTIPISIDTEFAYRTNKGYFGQATLPITSALHLTLGVRESTDYDRDFVSGAAAAGPPGSGAPLTPYDYHFAQTFHHFDYKARLDDDLTPQNMVYALVATGYRPGGHEIPSLITQSYGPEDLTSYEIGSKNRFFDDRAQLNAAVYYYDYNPFQYQLSSVLPNGQPATEIVTLPATIVGAELEGVLLPTPNDRINLSPAYIDDNFRNMTPAQLATIGNERVANAPRWELTGSYQHLFKIPNGATLAPMVDFRYQSLSWVVTPDWPVNQQDAYAVFDANLAYTSASGKYSGTFYIRNFTNEIYKVSGQVGPTMAVPTTPASNVNDTLGVPRTIGISVTAKFF